MAQNLGFSDHNQRTKGVGSKQRFSRMSFAVVAAFYSLSRKERRKEVAPTKISCFKKVLRTTITGFNV